VSSVKKKLYFYFALKFQKSQ